MKNISILMLLSFCLACAQEQKLYITQFFSRDELSFVNTENGAQMSFLKDALLPQDGEPHIETVAKTYLLPPNFLATSVKIVDANYDTIFAPAPKLFIENPSFAQNFAEPTPRNNVPVTLLRAGFWCGYALAAVEFAPVEFLSNENFYTFAKSITFEICGIQTPFHVAMPQKSSLPAQEFREKIAKTFEDPKQNLCRYTAPAKSSDSPFLLVITSQELLPTCLQLLDQTYCGYKTEFATVESISSVFSGSDVQEKVRNFILQRFESDGIGALAIVGDFLQVPVRYLYPIPRAGFQTEVVSDLYFAALDGNVNFNGDHLFGDSFEDDYYPELWLGRLQVENELQLRIFAQKLEAYRTTHPASFFSKLLFIGASVNTDGADISGPAKKNEILTATRLDTLFGVRKMYSHLSETGGDLLITEANFITELRNGFSFANHYDHGNQISLSMGSKTGGGSLTLEEVASLENSFYPLMYSFSCDVNKFDTDNIAKRWTINPRGGGIGMFAHSHQAWASQASMDNLFWDVFAFESPAFAGELFSRWQLHLVVSQYDNAIANFSGFPLTPISTKPDSITLEISDAGTFEVGDSTLSIHVDRRGNFPITYTIASRHRIFTSIETEAHDFTAHFAPVFDDTIFVVAHILPEKRCTIFVADARNYPLAVNAGVEELFGDGDNFPECGEVVMPFATVVNRSTTTRLTGSFTITIDSLSVHELLSFDIPPAETSKIFGTAFPLTDSIGMPKKLLTIIEFLEHTDSFYTEIAGPTFDIPGIFLRKLEHSDEISSFMPEPVAGDSAFFAIIINMPTRGGISYATAKLNTHFHLQPDSILLNMTARDKCDTIVFHTLLPADAMGEIPATLTVQNAFAHFEVPLLFHNVDAPNSLWAETYQHSVHLNWSNNVVNASGYFIYRQNCTTGPYTPANFPAVTNAFFVDESLGDCEIFNYRVAVVDEARNIGRPSELLFAWKTFAQIDGFPRALVAGVWPRSAPLIVDADLDGALELYVADINGFIYAFKADGTELVDTSDEVDPIIAEDFGLNTGFWSSLAAGDVDGDDTLDIVAVNRNGANTKLFCFNAFGKSKPGFPLAFGEPCVATPIVFDLDNDGNDEIIVHSQTRKLFIFRGDASAYRGTSALVDNFPEATGGYGFSSPAIGDVDGDGEMDIVVSPGTDAAGRTLIFAFDNSGVRKADFPLTTLGNVWGGIVLANIDTNFATDEIIFFAGGTGIHVLRADGTDSAECDGFPVSNSVINIGDALCSPSVADFNGDGRGDIVFISPFGIVAIDASGTPIAGFPKNFGNEHWSGGVIGFFDEDDIADIVFPAGNEIIAIDVAANLLVPGFPLRAGVGFSSPPQIIDFDGDGFLEIIAPSLDSKVNVWRTPYISSHARLLWSMFRQNINRTGRVLFESTYIEQQNQATSNINPRDQVYPNPFNNAIEIETYGTGHVKILDIRGNIVFERNFAHGKRLLWQPDTKIGSGIYFICVDDDNGSRIMRSIYLR